MSDLEQVIERLDRIETAVKFRPAWISGYVNLGRYIGRNDRRGRVAKAWADAEQITPKLINGVPHFSITDVDRAMRNGMAIETGEEVA